MRHGFKSVVRDLVRAHPGLSSDEYAQMALDKGLATSDSRNPVFSLQSTLRKEVRERRMPDVIARKVDGKLHFFPANQDPMVSVNDHASAVSGMRAHESVSLTVLVPNDIVTVLDLLVELNKVRNRADALLRFVRIGLDAKRLELDRASEFNQRTKKTRESFSL